MRHQVHGKKLNRSSGHRKALYRNLVESLVEHERITTTLVKAKAVRPVVEKLITRAKVQDLASRRAVAAFVPTSRGVEKMVKDLAPRFSTRPGGYTRIIKLGRRIGDGAEMAVIEFVELSTPTVKTSAPRVVKTGKKSELKAVSQTEVEVAPTVESDQPHGEPGDIAQDEAITEEGK